VTADPRIVEAGLPPDVEAILGMPESERSTGQRERVLRYFLETAPELASERDSIAKLRAQMPTFPTTLVFQERPADNARVTHFHHRGEFLQPKEAVQPGVPEILHQLTGTTSQRRLAFARWLVDSRNPLTARVTVNRQWQAFFGRGIVPTLEDFGVRGELPS